MTLKIKDHRIKVHYFSVFSLYNFLSPVLDSELSIIGHGPGTKCPSLSKTGIGNLLGGGD